MKKSSKMDPKLVSHEKHEIAYFKRKYGISAADVKAAMKEVGHSRKKILEKLTQMGLILTEDEDNVIGESGGEGE